VGAAAARLVKIGATIEPQARHAALYEDGFARYRQLQGQL
jgi:hypothetical protein